MTTQNQPLPEIAMMTANELADVLQMEYDDRVPRSILVCFVMIMDNAHQLLHGTRLVSDSITLDPSGHPLIPSLSDSRRAITDEEVAPMALPFIKEQMGPAMNTAMEQAVRWEQELNEGGGHDEAVIEEVASEWITYRPRPGTEVSNTGIDAVAPSDSLDSQAVLNQSTPASAAQEQEEPIRGEFPATHSARAVRAYTDIILYVAHVSLVITFFSLAAALMYSPLYMIGFFPAAALTVLSYVVGIEAKRNKALPKWLTVRNIKQFVRGTPDRARDLMDELDRLAVLRWHRLKSKLDRQKATQVKSKAPETAQILGK